MPVAPLPVLYGPGRDQPIPAGTAVPLTVAAGWTAAISFQISCDNEFVFDGYDAAALSGAPNATELFERGNYSRSMTPYVVPPQEEVKYCVTGWFKAGSGPNAHEPWRQAIAQIASTQTTANDNVMTLIQVVSFSIPGPALPTLQNVASATVVVTGHSAI